MGLREGGKGKDDGASVKSRNLSRKVFVFQSG
jgi:hypothetical protein